MKNTKNIALAAALLCSAHTALAQEVQTSAPDINPSWYIQPNIMAVDPDIDFGIDETGYGGGFRLGKPISRMWDIQLGASHVRADATLGDYRQTLLGIDALLMFSRKNFRPFVLFGLGAQRDDVDNRFRNVRDTSPFLTAGIGFQLGLTERWSMQADVRSVRGWLSSSDEFGTSVSNNKYASIGFNYALSLPPPPPPPEPEPAVEVQVVEPPPPPPPPPPRFVKVTLSATELFPFDSAQLGPSQPELDQIAAALKADPSITDVTITGYADRIGSERYNQALSERRAQTVRDYLVGQGVAAERLTAIGKGEANPVVTCGKMPLDELKECLRPNRRVEVEDITIERRVQ